MSQSVVPEDPEVRCEQRRIVHLLRNLLENLYLCRWPVSGFGSSRGWTWENLVCDMVELKRAIPMLPPDLCRIISLIGLQGLNEYEASVKLGLSRASINRRLWSAAALIQRTWRSGRRTPTRLKYAKGA